MNIAISQEFLTCLSGVPPSIAKKSREMISKFRMSPTGKGLNYERIQQARDRNFHSLRIDQDYRAIVWSSPAGGNFVFLWLDRHDASYEWARNRRVEINPEIGALQIYMVEDEPQKTAPAVSVPPGDAARTGLYSSLRDRELVRLGVPEELLPLVRSIMTEHDLENHESRLPALAYQGLYLFAAGYSYEDAVKVFERTETPSVNVEDESLLKNADSRSSFFLVEDDQILEEMLDAPLEKWRVFLHPTQRRLVEREWNGPVKVLGGPGTGKTVAALHRARWLSRNLLQDSGRKILFTTFTKNLALDIQEFLARICEPEELDRIEVLNIDAVARMVLRQHRFDQTVMFESSYEIQDLWEEALQEIPNDDLPRSFYREEWEEIIQNQQIRDLEAYKNASRAGRKTRLTRAQLVKIWPIFETYLELLRSHSWIESQDAFFAAAHLMQQKFLYESIIVDETQDMGIPALTFLRSLVPEQKNDLFLVGDAHQTLYNRKTVLSKAGIHVRGRSRKLLLNYRTTGQIGKWAISFLNGLEVSDLDDGADSLKGYHSLLSGPEPRDLRPLVPEDKITELRRLLQAIPEAEWSSTCIAVPGRESVNEWKANLDSWGIGAVILGKDDRMADGNPGIRISTIHRIKGLEFDRVIVKVPYDKQQNSRCLGFVAATRARKELVVM